MMNFGKQLRSALIVRDGFLNPDTAKDDEVFLWVLNTPLRKMIQNLLQISGTGNRLEQCVVECGLRTPGKWRT